MTVARTVTAILLATGMLAACTSSGDSGTSPSASGSADTSSPPASNCSKASAEKARGSFVTSAGFRPSCAKVKVKGQFFFVNNDKKTPHEVATKPGSPASFDVKLPKKQSTYTQVFSKPGTYVIVDKSSGKSMTLFVG